jgi:DNA-binding NtrC family response regulator
MVANTILLVFLEARINVKVRVGIQMLRLWQVIHSYFGRGMPRSFAVPTRVAVVALVVDEDDRRVLMSVAVQESLEVHFAESCDEAGAAASRLSAPIILLDRDWPGTEWRTEVERLAALPQGACVILVSGVTDAYLWQELIRQGGYDVLAKPLRAANIARVIKLALQYRTSGARPAKPARNQSRELRSRQRRFD